MTATTNRTDRFSHERFVAEFGDSYKFIQIERHPDGDGHCDFCHKKDLVTRLLIEGNKNKQFGVGCDCCKRHAPKVWRVVCEALGMNPNATYGTLVRRQQELEEDALAHQRAEEMGAQLNSKVPELKEIFNKAEDKQHPQLEVWSTRLYYILQCGDWDRVRRFVQDVKWQVDAYQPPN